MSQAQLPNELATFLENWTTDPNNAKDAFRPLSRICLLTTPDVRFEFKARPGVSYSLRAANAKNDERPLFVLVDVVDDEPEARWLSVCFYADLVRRSRMNWATSSRPGSWGRMPAASTLSNAAASLSS